MNHDNAWPVALGVPSSLSVSDAGNSFVRGGGAEPGQIASVLKHLMTGKATFEFSSEVFAAFEGYYEEWLVRGSRGAVIDLNIDDSLRTWVMYFVNGYTAKVNSGWGDVSISATIRLEEVV